MIMSRWTSFSTPARAVLAGSLFVTVLAADVTAQTGGGLSKPADGAGRYTFQQTQDGLLRLDTQSGELAVCRARDGKWSCESTMDDRRGNEAEIQQLRKDNAELRKEVKRLEEIAGIPAPPDPDKLPGTGRGSGGVQLPTEEDLDKAMSYMQRMLKKFKDKLKEFESEMGKSPEPKKGTQL